MVKLPRFGCLFYVSCYNTFHSADRKAAVWFLILPAVSGLKALLRQHSGTLYLLSSGFSLNIPVVSLLLSGFLTFVLSLFASL